MGRHYDPEIHHRKSMRLQGYDYRQAGAYFVSICAWGHECLFGEVIDGVAHLSAAGEMLQAAWDELREHYPGVDTDAFVVMPNHTHGIILLTASTSPPRQAGQTQGPVHTAQPSGWLSLPDVVHRFKSLTTSRYRHGVIAHQWQPFPGRLWQRNYYEHVIRDEDDLNRIREYIISNPFNWPHDENNPTHQP